ncbi:hypothetical protein CGCSCA4_v007267 [Colletotrichum siamense]|uniref:Ankyrin n=1 Tax=Colletotrichum siamense TaxID=690259 RepID=A0A9P5ESY3_COLSI|nr:hypothetical protein CGCSCA4_v007267 [Colletotrichum siamense]KAF4858894.1 hypothetical protein CGCSCA2_v006817 [Colletotrichum siamense]
MLGILRPFLRCLRKGEPTQPTFLLPQEIPFFIHGMGIDMLGLCRIILGSTKAFDVDFLNQSGKTPLMQCCQFMLESSKSYERMQPMASILIENGADLSICDKVGQSSCLLMFQMPQGFDYFDEVLYKFIDLDMLQNLRPTDLWLVASLARSIPSFKSKLEAEFQGIRTPIGISSSIRPRIEHLPELDPQKQASWVKNMIEPFLKCGIDVNETEMSDGKTYIRHAARKGNLEVVMALAQAGASLEQVEWVSKSTSLCASVLEDLLERWAFITQRKPIPGIQRSSPDPELWILPWLLRQPNHESHNALYAAMGWEAHLPPVIAPLLEYGYGRRDGQPAKTDHGQRCGSEVVDATKNRKPYLKQLLDAGLALECEDCLGISAVIYAVDLGELRALEMLIEAGADVNRQCGFGITPLELATINLGLPHPRARTRSLTYMHILPQDGIGVSLDTDQKLYDCIVRALKRKGVDITMSSMYPDHDTVFQILC